MIRKFIILFWLMLISCVFATTITNLNFATVSNTPAYIKTRAISNSTAYIESYLQSGGSSQGATVERMFVPNFTTGQSVYLTNVSIVGIFDNSLVTNETTVPYNTNSVTGLDIEDIKHTTNFIITTNTRMGKFDTSTTGAKIETGCILKIGDSYYPIMSISGDGTLDNSVAISGYLPSNTTQTIQAIYGHKFNPSNISIGSFDSTNDAVRIVGKFTSLNFGGNFLAPYDVINDDILVARTPTRYFYSTTHMPETPVIFKKDNGWWREFGPDTIRIINSGSSANSYVRIHSRDGTNFWVLYTARQSSYWYYSTNRLASVDVFQSIRDLGSKYWESIDCSPDGSIIYAAASGGDYYDQAGGATSGSDYIYKSTNYGVSFFPLTNMLQRNWGSVYTSDGITLYAGTYYSRGLAGNNSTNGVYYSTDGGNSYQLTSLWDTSAGARSMSGNVFLSIKADSNSNLYVCAKGYRVDNFATTPGVFQGRVGETNFTQIPNTGGSYICRPHDIIPHPTNTNLFYITYDLGGSGSTFTSKTTNRFATLDQLYTDEYELANGVDYRAVCFSPQNPNIGYAVFNDDQFESTTKSIMKTINGGQTWTNVAPASLYWVSVATYDGETVYAAPSHTSRGYDTGEFARYLYYSTNGGTTWTPLTNAVANWIKLVMPTSNRVYALAKYSSSGADEGSGGISMIYEIDTTNNVLRIPNGRLDYINATAYNGLKTWDGTNFYLKISPYDQSIALSGRLGGGSLSIDMGILESTNSCEDFQLLRCGTNLSYAYAGLWNISDFTKAKITNIWYHAQVSDGIYKSTDTVYTVNRVHAGGLGLYRQLWCSDNGQVVYCARRGETLGGTNYGISKSTNYGVTWSLVVTNVLNWQGITSYNQGNTLIISREDGTVGIVSNALTVNTALVAFVTGSPSMYYLNLINTNLIFGFNLITNGSYYYTTNRGTTWRTNFVPTITNQPICWIEDDPTDPTSNTYWITTFEANYLVANRDNSTEYSHIWKTTNNFATVESWATNNTKQMFYGGGLGSFDIAKTDSNLVVVTGLENGTGYLYYSTNGFRRNSFIVPNAVQASTYKKSWTGVSTYNGREIYFLDGMYGNLVNSYGYIYKLDIPNDRVSYLDNYRSRVYTDINTPDGTSIWATTRIELHKMDLPPVPTNYYSIVTASLSPTSFSWTTINDILPTINTWAESFGEVDFAFSFDNNKSFVIWDDQWTAITTNDSVWKYWNGSTFTASYSNSSPSALSDAMSFQSNRMSSTQMSSIAPNEWLYPNGFNTNTTTNVYVGVIMRSTNGFNPNIANILFNINTEGDQFRKKDKANGGYSVVFEPTNGVYTITRTNQMTDTYIYYMETQ